MKPLFPLLFALCTLSSPLPANPGKPTHWDAARAVCAQMVLRAERLASDPGHARILSAQNRFLAQQKAAFLTQFGGDAKQPLDVGVRLHLGEYPTEADLGPAAEVDAAIRAVEEAGGQVRVTQTGTAHFTVTADGAPLLVLNPLSGQPLSLAHELGHFVHWKELVQVLAEQMPRAEAGILAMQLMDTPEGLWITEHRAVEYQLKAALGQGLTDKPAVRRPAYLHQLPRESLWRSNYPAMMAIGQTLRFSIILDRQQEIAPELTEEILRAKEKLVADLALFVDQTVVNTITEWDRQVKARTRQPGMRPTSFVEFFGRYESELPEDELLDNYFEQLTLTYLLEGVDKYFNTTVRPPVSLPRSRPSSTVWSWFRLWR